MGLFSSSTKVYVSSSVWNLAGAAEDRAKFLPSVMVSSILSGRSESVAASVRGALLSSTATRTRRFFSWASRNYELGMPTGSVGVAYSLATTDVTAPLRAALRAGDNQRIQIFSAVVDGPDVEHWGEAWVAENHPDKLETSDWEADLDFEAAELVVTLDGTEHRSPAPEDLLWARYSIGRTLLFVSYKMKTKDSTGRWTSSPFQLFTYRMGSGTKAFDNLAPTRGDLQEFYPALPLRIDNTSLTELDYSDNVFAAFKKLTGSELDDVLENIEDHENVGDMDHVFVMPGVSLNTTEQSGKAYLFRFFQLLAEKEDQTITFDSQFNENLARIRSDTEWTQFESSTPSLLPRLGFMKSAKASTVPLLESRSLNELSVTMQDMPEYRMMLRWQAIEQAEMAGNAARFDGGDRSLLKKGSYWVYNLTMSNEDIDALPPAFRTLLLKAPRQNDLLLFHQFDEFRFRMVRIRGLEHLNYVYGDKSVRISAKDALEDEEESGFIVPLHYPTMKSLGALKNAELSNSSLYVVINSYKKVKKKWYQKGIFKVVLVVAAIAIAVISQGAALPQAVGLLGQNAAVGLAVGASAATAALVGAVVNGIAAAIVTTLIANVSTTLFGEKWGAIISTIASFIALQVGTQFAASGSFNVDWGSMFHADNLMQLTDAVGDAYSKFVTADTMEIYEKLGDLAEGFEDQLEKIEQLSRDVLGMTNVQIDPMMFSDASEYFGEPRDAYLGRTLMTGSDIAELSLSMIESFAELSLELPGAL